MSASDSDDTYEYDVALSFAGEDREIVSQVAQALRDIDIRVFYDKFQEATLWGKNLYTYLQELYYERARYVLVFLSRHYPDKPWPRHELESAQSRAFSEVREYILPVRLDASRIPGILDTVGFVEYHKLGAQRIAVIVREKLGAESERGIKREALRARRGIVNYWPTKTDALTEFKIAFAHPTQELVVCGITLNTIEPLLRDLEFVDHLVGLWKERKELLIKFVVHLPESGPSFEARDREKDRDLKSAVTLTLENLRNFYRAIGARDSLLPKRIEIRHYQRVNPYHFFVLADDRLYVAPYFASQARGSSFLMRLADTGSGSMYYYYCHELRHIVRDSACVDMAGDQRNPALS